MSKAIFSVLLLLKGRDYDVISEKTRSVISSFFVNMSETEGNIDDHQNWYSVKVSYNSNKVTIRHYKMRIICEQEEELGDENLAVLFSKARKKRDELDKISYLDFVNALKNQPNIDKVCSYSLIEVIKDYKVQDFKSFEKESITSFFYEVPDYRREKKGISKIIQKIIPIFLSRTIIRLSRPSVITSKMSNFMKMKVINILYDTCLYDLRKQDSNKISDATFRSMKDYLGKILFDIETSNLNSEMSRSLNVLSLIMGIGAIAAILAIIVCIPFLDSETLYSFKNLLAIILGVWAFIILIVVLINNGKNH